MSNLSGLQAAYDFYKKVKASQNKEVLEKYPWEDARQWVLCEINALLENPTTNPTGWIRVTERLPKIDFNNECPVSEYVFCEGIEKEGEQNSIFMAYYAEDNYFHSLRGQCHEVIHWQPIPKFILNDSRANPALFQGEEWPPCPCPNCDEPIYFMMKDKRGLFNLKLSTLITCLKFAENEKVIPPIAMNWWYKMSRHFGFIPGLLKDNTYSFQKP